MYYFESFRNEATQGLAVTEKAQKIRYRLSNCLLCTVRYTDYYTLTITLCVTHRYKAIGSAFQESDSDNRPECRAKGMLGLLAGETSRLNFRTLRVNLPKVELPKVELPKVELLKVELHCTASTCRSLLRRGSDSIMLRID